MNISRIAILASCMLVLQGCWTYSNPYEPGGRAEFRGVYDEYAYDTGEPIVDLTIADAAYYPWWSIDYYYFGNHFYRPGYIRGPYNPFGYGPAFPGRNWLFYAYYSPYAYLYPAYTWYDPWYGWPSYGMGMNVYWTEIYWPSRYPEYFRDDDRVPSPVYDVGSYVTETSLDEAISDRRDRANPSDRLVNREATPISRSVWTAPSMSEAEPSMQVRSRRERKIQESRIGPAPVQRTTSRPAVTASSAPPATPPSWSAGPATAPPMVRQVQPPPAHPGTASQRPASPAPAFSEPRIIHQVQPSQPRPGTPSRSDSGADDSGGSPATSGPASRKND